VRELHALKAVEFGLSWCERSLGWAIQGRLVRAKVALSVAHLVLLYATLHTRLLMGFMRMIARL
jgi:hypothetical protein